MTAIPASNTAGNSARMVSWLSWEQCFSTTKVCRISNWRCSALSPQIAARGRRLCCPAAADSCPVGTRRNRKWDHFKCSDHFKCCDASARHNEEDFRKACDRIIGRHFVNVQEVREDACLKVDVWKRATAEETITIRPNHGRQTFMVKFGKCFQLLELNKPPTVSEAGKVVHAPARRDVVGHPKAKPAADAS